MKNAHWHTLSGNHVVKMLKTDEHSGLSSDEVRVRLEKYGLNIFTHEERETFFHRLILQFRSPLVLILLLAGVATLVLGEYIDATVIFIALLVNVGIGFFQESRASQAFEKLASSQEHIATVVRDGTKHVISADKLVPGDVIEFHAGSLVPADIYITRARELEISEAPLTGESVPVEKLVGKVELDTPITEQNNMAWMGTFVVSGDGRGVVVATGDSTQIGDIAEGLTDTEEVLTPVQRNIRRLARFLSILVFLTVLVIFFLGIFRGEEIETMIILAIAVAVSVIPEGLPAAVTAVLAIGMEKILSRGGLVRNLLAAETLGSTTVILTDKTGTLTQAQMKLFLFITATGESSDVLSPDAELTLKAAVYASDAFIEQTNDGAVVRGRPIEQAVIRRAQETGVTQQDFLNSEPQQDFLPFASENRFAASLNARGDGRVLYVSGAPGTLLEAAGKVLRNGEEETMTEQDREKFREQMNVYAQQGVRFIAVGYRNTYMTHIPEVDSSSAPDLLEGLVFGGLLGFEDPIRADVPEAIKKAKSAGAHIIMLTGDNPETARSIAMQADIVSSGASVVRGTAVEDMTDDELKEVLKTTQVFARVLPNQKLRIVKLLQKEGEVVAMTGDGINDAPALKRADIGIAVGSGTEVAQEASDLVLLNDSFSIVVAAIEEGRRIIDNLKKVITHLLSTSFHEVFIVVFAIAGGFPLPVLPVQILWVNILQEGFLNFGFAFEPAETGLMKRDPYAERTKTILTKEIRKLIIIAGIVTSIFSVALFFILLTMGLPIEEIRTIMFVVLSLDSLFFAVSLKHLRKPFWHGNLLNNHYLLFALGLSALGLVLTLTVPVLRELLSLVPLSMSDVFILIGVGLFNLLTIEMTKHFVFKGKSWLL